MAMEMIKSQIAEAGTHEIAQYQAGVAYITEVAQTWAARVVEAYGLHEASAEEAGNAVYEHTKAALHSIDHDATSWNVVAHSYARTQDGGWEPAVEHQAMVSLGWVMCERLEHVPRPRGSRMVRPSYQLKPTATGRVLIDGLRAVRGEVDSATQHEINRQRYRSWLEAVKASRPSGAL